jgi:NIMA (never in mitosis gene a)-related kinase
MEKYERIKLLGKGSFGKVYLMRQRKDRKLVCVKTINVRGIPKKERDACKMEVALLKKLDHPNIVGYYESCLSKDRATLCIVMGYCDGGDLEVYIKKRSQLRESQIMHFFVQIVLGVDYLHSQKVLHRDLKTQNIFLLGNGRLVLGDLGISKVLDGTLDMARTKIGTPYYMAPEIFRDRPYSAGADVWALGVVLYEMTTKRHAFEAQSMAELMRKVMAASYRPLPSSCGEQLRKLCSSMLLVDHKRRPSTAEILRSSYAKKHLSRYLGTLLLVYS